VKCGGFLAWPLRRMPLEPRYLSTPWGEGLFDHLNDCKQAVPSAYLLLGKDWLVTDHSVGGTYFPLRFPHPAPQRHDAGKRDFR